MPIVALKDLSHIARNLEGHMPVCLLRKDHSRVQ